MTAFTDEFTRQQDERIRQDVSRNIRWRADIKSKDIGVNVVDGTVALSGFVHSYLEKWAAQKAAQSVYGVKAVSNDIEVRPSQARTDPEIARDIVASMKLHSSIPDEKIKTAVKDGWVTLEGTVEWHYQRELAERTAQSITGVKGTTNLIEIKPPISTSQVQNQIDEAFRNMADIDARSMLVTAHDGTVELHGHVHSWAEKQRAERVAWFAPGVRRVDNQLVVTP